VGCFVVTQRRKEVERGFYCVGAEFDVNIGKAACEARSAMWNLGTNSGFVPEPRKMTENLNRVGMSQDLPAFKRVLTSAAALL
jgi:hypothetical protein